MHMHVRTGARAWAACAQGQHLRGASKGRRVGWGGGRWDEGGAVGPTACAAASGPLPASRPSPPVGSAVSIYPDGLETFFYGRTLTPNLHPPTHLPGAGSGGRKGRGDRTPSLGEKVTGGGGKGGTAVARSNCSTISAPRGAWGVEGFGGGGKRRVGGGCRYGSGARWAAAFLTRGPAPATAHPHPPLLRPLKRPPRTCRPEACRPHERAPHARAPPPPPSSCGEE